MQNPAWCALVGMCRSEHTGTHGEGRKEMREQEESLIEGAAHRAEQIEELS